MPKENAEGSALRAEPPKPSNTFTYLIVATSAMGTDPTARQPRCATLHMVGNLQSLFRLFCGCGFLVHMAIQGCTAWVSYAMAEPPGATAGCESERSAYDFIS
jgi:hypothetical protein